MKLYIITIVVRNEIVRVQSASLKFSIGFAGWCAVVKGHRVRGRYGDALLRLGQREQNIGTRLVSEYSNDKRRDRLRD